MLSEWEGRSNVIAGLEREQVYINYMIHPPGICWCDSGVGHIQ